MIAITSDDDQGNVYIETGALDGEKNLKPKSAIPEISCHFTKEKFEEYYKNKQLALTVYAKEPTQDLYQFEGSSVIDSLQGVKEKGANNKLILTGKSLLLRGAYLRNTEWIYGIVVYTGMDTKIMMNAEKAKQKQSQIEKNMNTYIVLILLFQIGLCLLMALLNFYWNYNNSQSHW